MSKLLGTNVIAPIVPQDSADTYPTHINAYGKGGWKAVVTLAERDAIPVDRMELYMRVAVEETGVEYKLVNLDPVTWEEIVIQIPSTASDIAVSTTNFDGNLSIADNTVQKALETLDELVAGGSGHAIMNDGVVLPTETNLEFTNKFAVTDLPIQDKSQVDLNISTGYTLELLNNLVEQSMSSSYDDTFTGINGTSYDPNKWTGTINFSNPASTCSIYNNALRFALQANESGSYTLRTNTLFDGNFDIEISLSESISQHTDRLSIGLGFRGETQGFIGIRHHLYTSGLSGNQAVVDTSSWYSVANYTDISVTPEAFRIVRNGNLFTLYYKTGGSWVAVSTNYSYVGFGTDRVRAELYIHKEANYPAVNIDFDNFKVNSAASSSLDIPFLIRGIDVTDHGEQTGLGDDDHPQYHNDARGDFRYAPIAKGVTNGDSHDHNGGDGAQISYATLSNVPSTFAPSAHNQAGSTITLDTTNFNSNLSSADNTVQKALETLDELVSGEGGGGLLVVQKSVVNNNDTLAVNTSNHVSTSGGAFVLYLPASSNVGDHIQIHDSTNTFGTYNLTLNNNGQLINGQNDSLVCDISGAVLNLYYEGSTLGWKVVVDSNSGIISGIIGATEWTDYTPIWTASTTNPSIGDGILKGRYKFIDNKTVALYLFLQFKSTTTAGSGAWTFSLPLGVTTPDTATQVIVGGCQDALTDNKLVIGKIPPNSTIISELTPEGGNVITSTSPMTWTINDNLYLSGIIEVQ